MTNNFESDTTCATPFLVIGWGNVLRGDDAAGRRVAEAVAAWTRHDVTALPVHQLTPELADTLADARRVVFVDAYAAAGTGAPVRVEHLTAAPVGPGGTVGHHGDPAHLLQLAGQLYGNVPDAWLIGIPAFNFALGETLSPETARGVADAMQQVERLLAGTLRTTI
ncbi:MAG: hydrogenase maturation protease [Lentisphaerae bacterium]|nr:hydrogenase maturation protease [Lentisphaerota bacterium]